MTSIMLLLVLAVPSAFSLLPPVCHGPRINYRSCASDRVGQAKSLLCVGKQQQGGSDDATFEAEMVLVRGMRATHIKKMLADMTISTVGVFEVGILLLLSAGREP